MRDTTGNAAHASLVFLGLVDFARKPVAEQAALRERLDAAVARTIAPLDPADRIVADAPEGLAIAILAAPSEALLAARRVRRLARGEGGEPFALRIGVDHGPIRLAADERGDPCLAGDSVATGATIAGFSEPGRILVSRAFRDALAPTDPERTARLQPAGTQTDPNLRKHELYLFEGPPGDSDAAAGATPVRRRRRPLILAGVAAAALLGTGFAVRAARQRAQAAARRPAVVALAIEPWGEVVIDGVSRGRTPPLARIEVPPGKHTIEVRHPPQQPVALKVDLDPGEELALRYTFAPAAAPPAVQRQRPQTPKEQPSKVRRMWNDFRKQAGF
jgi:PEGA domain